MNFQIGGHLLIEEISDLLDTSHREMRFLRLANAAFFIFL